jgi:hypothetical protein
VNTLILFPSRKCSWWYARSLRWTRFRHGSILINSLLLIIRRTSSWCFIWNLCPSIESIRRSSRWKWSRFKTVMDCNRMNVLSWWSDYLLGFKIRGCPSWCYSFYLDYISHVLVHIWCIVIWIDPSVLENDQVLVRVGIQIFSFSAHVTIIWFYIKGPSLICISGMQSSMSSRDVNCVIS